MKLKLLFVACSFVLVGNINAQIKSAEVLASGLTCSMCSKAIFKALSQLDFVDTVKVNLNSNTFTVTLKEGNELSPKIFKEKVEKAGFFIGSLILTAKAETVSKSPYILVNDKKIDATEVKFQVVDKGYVTEKEFKKLSKSYKDIATYVANNEDDFHIKILN